MYGIVYCALNTVNNKVYIGQTIKSLERRKVIHYWYAKKQLDNSYFHNALRKYKKDNWKWFIITECDNREELNNKEMICIQLFKSIGLAYNLREGGARNLGYKHTKEELKKMSKAQKGNTNALGCKHPHSKKTKQKMSEAGKKKIFTEKHRKNMSIARIGNTNGCGNKGKYMGINKKSSKAVICIETNIKFNSICEAERKTNISHMCISRAANNKQKTAGKYHWQFIKQEAQN